MILPNRTRIVALLIIVLATSPFLAESAADGTSRAYHEELLFEISPPEISFAPVAVVMDYDTGEVLFGRNPDTPHVPASLTKLVTIYAALESSREGNFPLDQPLPVDPRAYASAMAPGSSLMFLGPDQFVSGWDLLRGLAVSSGNDAAVEVALRASGSVSAFSGFMNSLVRSLGLGTFYFEEAAGLSPGNRITAREMALFTRILLEEWPETVDTLFALPHFAYPEAHHYSREVLQGGTILQHNRNTLLDMYPGADGLKTGYTSAAGYNLAATATRDGRRLIVVVLGIDAPNHIAGAERRTRDAIELLDWGFTNFRTVRPARPDPGLLRVLGGRERSVALLMPDPPPLVVPASDIGSLRGEIELPDHVWAPRQAGERAGTVRYVLGDRHLAEVPLLFETTVGEGNIFRRIWDRLALWWAGLTGRVL